MAEFPEVREVRRVALGPDDRLVVNLERVPTADELGLFKDEAAKAFGIDQRRLLVLAGIADWRVVGPVAPERAALRELLALILDEMAAAGNRDMAADGPVGDEEGRVWRKIEKLALKFRQELFEDDASG